MNLCRVVCVLLILFVFQSGKMLSNADDHSNEETSEGSHSSSEKRTPDCPGMFQCRNSTCIDKNKICNAETDCLMNQDEDDCVQPSNMADACSSLSDCEYGGCAFTWYCEERHCSCHMYEGG